MFQLAEEAAVTLGGVVMAIIGVCLTGVTGGLSWLILKVLGQGETIVKLETKIESLQNKLEEVTKSALTQECVTEAIEKALDKRDRVADDRRREWDKRTSMEIKLTVQEEMNKTKAEIVKEVRSATGAFHGKKIS